MKAMTMYKCELCGRTYENKSDCENCESKHIKPIEICSSNHEVVLFDHYPSWILIKFDNGTVKKYCYDIR